MQIVASLEHSSGEQHWCKEPEKEQPVIQLQHLLSPLEWEQREEEHTHAQKLACQMVISVGFSYPAHALLIKHTAATGCALWGGERFLQ